MRWLLFLTLVGCSPTLKILRDKNPKVISRLTNTQCVQIWTVLRHDSVSEMYGPPCDIELRFEHQMKFDREKQAFIPE